VVGSSKRSGSARAPVDDHLVDQPELATGPMIVLPMIWSLRFADWLFGLSRQTGRDYRNGVRLIPPLSRRWHLPPIARSDKASYGLA
jgi:hypothetical protein